LARVHMGAGVGADRDGAQVGLPVVVAGGLVDRDRALAPGQRAVVDARLRQVAEHLGVGIVRGARGRRAGQQRQQRQQHRHGEGELAELEECAPHGPVPWLPPTGNWESAPEMVGAMPRVAPVTAPVTPPTRPLMLPPESMPSPPTRPSEPCSARSVAAVANGTGPPEGPADSSPEISSSDISPVPRVALISRFGFGSAIRAMLGGTWR